MVQTFNGESDSHDLCSGCGRQHNAHPPDKVKSHIDILISVFTPSGLHLLSKTS